MPSVCSNDAFTTIQYTQKKRLMLSMFVSLVVNFISCKKDRWIIHKNAEESEKHQPKYACLEQDVVWQSTTSNQNHTKTTTKTCWAYYEGTRGCNETNIVGARTSQEKERSTKQNVKESNRRGHCPYKG